jgi:hypothetical protein
MKSLVLSVVVAVFTTTSMLAQASMPSGSSMISNVSKISNEIRYIDNDGRAGMLSSSIENNGVRKLTFVTQTEIGESTETYFLTNDEITEVIVNETEYNRPKFWNEQVAKSNGDDEWFDPEKSVSTQITYLFKDGDLASWSDQEGNTTFAITKAADKKEKHLKKRYSAFVKALGNE